MAGRRFRPKKGKNPESIAPNVEFIKNRAKEGLDTEEVFKEVPRSVKAVLRTKGLNL